MADDLDLIRCTLNAPPPTARATVQARRRLLDAIEQPERRRRSWWRPMVGATALAGVAAAAVAVAALQNPTAAPGPSASASAAAAVQPRQILLAAANRAAAEPTGRYWHVQWINVVGPYRVGSPPDEYNLVSRGLQDFWITTDPASKSWIGGADLGFQPRPGEDEQRWRAAGSPTEWVVSTDTTSGTTRYSTAPSKVKFSSTETREQYLTGYGGLTAAEIAELPSDPAALRAFAVAQIALRNGFPPGSWESDSQLFNAMTELLLDAPATPDVRTAAFTVLADLPGIRVTGEATDGQGRPGVRIELSRTRAGITEYQRLLIDPQSHLILAMDYSAGLGESAPNGQPSGSPIKERHRVILRAEWTDAEPAPPTVP